MLHLHLWWYYCCNRHYCHVIYTIVCIYPHQASTVLCDQQLWRIIVIIVIMHISIVIIMIIFTIVISIVIIFIYTIVCISSPGFYGLMWSTTMTPTSEKSFLLFSMSTAIGTRQVLSPNHHCCGHEHIIIPIGSIILIISQCLSLPSFHNHAHHDHNHDQNRQHPSRICMQPNWFLLLVMPCLLPQPFTGL